MRFKGAIVGLVALGVLALGVANASASTVSPSGKFTTTSTGFGIAVGSTAIGCWPVSVDGTLNASGTGSTSSISLTGCRDFGPGTTGLLPTVTANTQWHVAISGTATGTATTFSNISLHVNYPTLSCGFDIVGSVTVPNAGSTIASWSFEGGDASTLTTANATAGCARFALGSRQPYFGSRLTLGTPLTVSS